MSSKYYEEEYILSGRLRKFFGFDNESTVSIETETENNCLKLARYMAPLIIDSIRVYKYVFTESDYFTDERISDNDLKTLLRCGTYNSERGQIEWDDESED